jgi:general secretion pathway protein G
MKRAGAFTLVEILIVVVLLGVLAAMVVPTFSRATTPAKESAMASELALLRRFVLIYASQHLEVAPGYPNGDSTAAPTEAAFRDQAMLSSNTSGQTAAIGMPGFPHGPYLSRIPINPFNGRDTVHMLANGQAFPAAADNNHGWICRPETGEVRPDNTGVTGDGLAYYDF